jgi:two-component system LytT family response regulator
MFCDEKIRTVVIDDDKDFIFNLTEQLTFVPEVELVASATHYKQAKQILLHGDFDLAFLDIEMPVKNGFELLNEVREARNCQFDVVFHTAYDSYVIDALRESALDYILKPAKLGEIQNAISRFVKKRAENKLSQLVNVPVIPGVPEIVSLPTITGMRFVDKKSIVLFQCVKDSVFDKASWEVMLNDKCVMKLHKNISAKDLINFMGASRCAQISQSAIVNVAFLSMVEFKTRKCILLPPFDTINLTVSRNSLIELREKFELL